MIYVILFAKNKIGLNKMCETCKQKMQYEQCDFCGDLLSSNHFYPVDTTKAGRNVPLSVDINKEGGNVTIDMLKEPKPKMCNWCFSEMVGVTYNPIKSDHQYK